MPHKNIAQELSNLEMQLKIENLEISILANFSPDIIDLINQQLE